MQGIEAKSAKSLRNRNTNCFSSEEKVEVTQSSDVNATSDENVTSPQNIDTLSEKQALRIEISIIQRQPV